MDIVSLVTSIKLFPVVTVDQNKLVATESLKRSRTGSPNTAKGHREVTGRVKEEVATYVVEGNPRPVCRALKLPDVMGEVLVEGLQGQVVGSAASLGLVRR